MRYNNNSKPKGGFFKAKPWQVAQTPPTPLLDRLNPSDCVQWPLCPAQVCPFDSAWKEHIGYTGTAVCPYLQEALKEKPNPFFATFYGEGLLAELKAVIPIMMKQHPVLKKGLSA